MILPPSMHSLLEEACVPLDESKAHSSGRPLDLVNEWTAEVCSVVSSTFEAVVLMSSAYIPVGKGP